MRTIALLLLVSLNGCVPVIKIINGFHHPKPEDKESLIHYLKKKNINADNILVYSDSINYKKKFHEIRSVPEMQVFNADGTLIYYRDTAAGCSAPAYEFTTMICSAGDLMSNPSKTITLETKNLLTLDNKPFVISKDGNYDFYVFIYWARFLGRLNKVKTKVWENNLKNVKGCKVLVYKVDMDWQKKWNEK